MKCSLTKADNSQCKANATSGSSYCFRHNPDLRDAGILASQKGGFNRRLQGAYGQEVALREPRDVNTFLGEVINSVWTGRVPVQVGTSMGFLTRCWLDAYEASEVAKRLNSLEERLSKVANEARNNS